jgi:hypothetical protein
MMMKICMRKALRRRPDSHRHNVLLLHRLLFLLLSVLSAFNNNNGAFIVVTLTQSFELAQRRQPPQRRRTSIITRTGSGCPRLGQPILVRAAAARDQNSNPWQNDDEDGSSRSLSSSAAMGRRRFGRNGRLKMDSSSSWKDVWGVERRASYSFPFPLDVATLAEQIVAAAWAAMVAGSGRTNGGGDGAPAAAVGPSLVMEASMDPNIVQNALYGDRMFGRRPVRSAVLDAGRIGIEIDGPTTVNVMYVALRVAAHASLVQQMQQPQPHQQQPRAIIPVALYFATVRETLMARELLHRLRLRSRQNKNNDPIHSSWPPVWPMWRYYRSRPTMVVCLPP